MIHMFSIIKRTEEGLALQCYFTEQSLRLVGKAWEIRTFLLQIMQMQSWERITLTDWLAMTAPTLSPAVSLDRANPSRIILRDEDEAQHAESFTFRPMDNHLDALK